MRVVGFECINMGVIGFIDGTGQDYRGTNVYRGEKRVEN